MSKKKPAAEVPISNSTFPKCKLYSAEQVERCWTTDSGIKMKMQYVKCTCSKLNQDVSCGGDITKCDRSKKGGV